MFKVPKKSDEVAGRENSQLQRVGRAKKTKFISKEKGSGGDRVRTGVDRETQPADFRKKGGRGFQLRSKGETEKSHRRKGLRIWGEIVLVGNGVVDSFNTQQSRKKKRKTDVRRKPRTALS